MASEAEASLCQSSLVGE